MQALDPNNISSNPMLCVVGTLKVTDQNMLPESPSATCKKEKAGDYCLLAGESNRVVSLPRRSNMSVALFGLRPTTGTGSSLCQSAQSVQDMNRLNTG